ncbi:hypothetical protein ASZ90_003313 [hydrocarbon metagenome]|uniref:DUF4835 domain-containing protein n=1 Tax=hydrocarbon metagenome TaxID=938273 RepID=A0A0W8G2T3_9ZZZZ
MKKILILFVFIPVLVYSQEIRAKVTVNYEQLNNAAKERLVDFQYAVENYLNDTRFTEYDWEGDPIACSFNIFFTGSSGETRYSAQVVVNSQRPIYRSQRSSLILNVMDKEWGFEYERNQTLRYNLVSFDPLTSFLDFYAYLIIGFDMDSFSPLGGSPFFERAYEIALLGANSGFSKGWALESSAYNKRSLLDEIQNVQYNQFRRDYYDYHFNGLDIYQEKKTVAQKNMIKLVDNLFNAVDKMARNSVLLKVFFDAKAGELVDYLEGVDETVFKKLMRINPANISRYEKAISG